MDLINNEKATIDDILSYIEKNNIYDIRDISNICQMSLKNASTNINTLCKQNDTKIYKALLNNLGFVIDSDNNLYKDTYNQLMDLYNVAYEKDKKLLFVQYTTSDELLHDALKTDNLTLIKFIIKYKSSDLCNVFLTVCENERNSKELVHFIISIIKTLDVNFQDILLNLMLLCIDMCNDEKCNIINIIDHVIKTHADAPVDFTNKIKERCIQTDNIFLYKKINKDNFIGDIKIAITCKAYKILDFIETKINSELIKIIEVLLLETIQKDDTETYKFIIDFICYKKTTDHFEKYLLNMNNNIIDNAPKVKKLIYTN